MAPGLCGRRNASAEMVDGYPRQRRARIRHPTLPEVLLNHRRSILRGEEGIPARSLTPAERTGASLGCRILNLANRPLTICYRHPHGGSSPLQHQRQVRTDRKARSVDSVSADCVQPREACDASIQARPRKLSGAETDGTGCNPPAAPLPRSAEPRDASTRYERSMFSKHAKSQSPIYSECVCAFLEISLARLTTTAPAPPPSDARGS